MTYPPGQPGGQWQGGYPPQQPYPQPGPGAYPQRPASTGLAITALVLCTVSAVLQIWFLIQTVMDYARPFALQDTQIQFLLQSLVAVVCNLLFLLGVILMWCRIPVGRTLAIIATAGTIVATDITPFVFAAVFRYFHLDYDFLGYLYIALDIVVFVFLLLPNTGRYLRSRRPPQVQGVMPGYAPQGYPPQGYPPQSNPPGYPPRQPGP